jgi:hypothetical protein
MVEWCVAGVGQQQGQSESMTESASIQLNEWVPLYMLLNTKQTMTQTEP